MPLIVWVIGSLKTLIWLLKQRNPAICTKAADMLIEIGEPAVRLLEKIVKSEPPTIQQKRTDADGNSRVETVPNPTYVEAKRALAEIEIKKERETGDSSSNSASSSSNDKQPKNYPARLIGEVIEPTVNEIQNLALYFSGKDTVVLVDKTVTGKIADIKTIPGKIAVLKGLAARAPPFNVNNPASQAFQVFINDIIRHELKELETASHRAACKASYEYFRKNPKELAQLLKAVEQSRIELDRDFQQALLKLLLDKIPLARDSSIKVVIFDWGNVISRFDWRLSAKEFARRFGIDEDLTAKLLADEENNPNHPLFRHERGMINEEQLIKEIKQLLGLENAEITQQDFEDIFNSTWINNTIGEVVSLIQILKAKGYKVYLLTTTNAITYRYFVESSELFRQLGLKEKL